MLLHRTRLSEPAWGSCPRSGRDGQRTGRGTDNVRAGGRTTYGQWDGQRTDMQWTASDPRFRVWRLKGSANRKEYAIMPELPVYGNLWAQMSVTYQKRLT